MKIRRLLFLFLLFQSVALFPSDKSRIIDSQSTLIRALEGLQFPEGPAWDGHGRLFASNCRGDWISVIGPDTQRVFLRAGDQPFTFGKTNGLTFFRDGSLYACDFGVGAIVRITMDGKGRIVAAGYQGKRFNRPNDLAFDRAGNLYFTDPNQYDRNNPDGVVYRLDHRTREVTPAAIGLAFPNGLAFSADGRWLFVCESAFERVLKFRVQADGSLTDRSVFIDLPGGDPDGIAFDRKGRLFIAHFGGGAVYVVDAKGKIIEKIILPGKKPSNVEFADPDFKTLYITEDEGNTIYRLRLRTSGRKLFCAPE